jgi:hypothetical protein
LKKSTLRRDCDEDKGRFEKAPAKIARAQAKREW